MADHLLGLESGERHNKICLFRISTRLLCEGWNFKGMGRHEEATAVVQTRGDCDADQALREVEMAMRVWMDSRGFQERTSTSLSDELRGHHGERG